MCHSWYIAIDEKQLIKRLTHLLMPTKLGWFFFQSRATTTTPTKITATTAAINKGTSTPTTIATTSSDPEGEGVVASARIILFHASYSPLTMGHISLVMSI